ncbi:MAG: CBS domain-containing protein [Spirochaetales bacterium]|nr:CBS domain-containing protein [Spirochaetales bacterium]
MKLAGEIAATTYRKVEPFQGVTALTPSLLEDAYAVVEEENRYLGLLTINDLLRNPKKMVIDCVTPKPQVGFEATLVEVLAVMRRENAFALPVYRDGEFYGIISITDILENLVGGPDSESTGQALSLLAASVSHDFNNILTSVLGFITLVMQQEADNEKYCMLQYAEKGLLRAKQIARQLTNCSLEGAAETEPADVNLIIREIVPFVLRKTRITHTLKLEVKLRFVSVDHARFYQTVTNLAVNAIEAMGDAGELTVKTENVDSNEAPETPSRSPFLIRVSFRDTGRGIASSDLDRVFKPYFTTKVKGTGLGLAIVDAFVKTQRGRVIVSSGEKAGTEFNIYLPAYSDEDSRILREEYDYNNYDQMETTRRMIILDDDAESSRILPEYLRYRGCRCLLTHTIEKTVEAVGEAFRKSEPYEVVFIDLVLPPENDAVACLNAVRAIDPNIKTVLTSSTVEHPVAKDFSGYGFDALLLKPFTVKDIKSVLGI